MLYLNHSLIKEMVLKMENYKIKVNNEAESKEAQELFFELDIGWFENGKVVSCAETILRKEFGWLVACKPPYLNNTVIHIGYGTEPCEEITLHELRDLVAAHRKPTEQGLISGADALRALANGEEVEFKDGMNKWENIKHHMNLDLSMFLTAPDWMSFRLKPRTIKLGLEITKPKVVRCVGNTVVIEFKDHEDALASREALRGALKNG